MTTIMNESLPLPPSGTVSWIHIGDIHMTRKGEQNEIDLGRIVDEINGVYAKGGIDFVYVPGDIADDGSVTAYEAVRSHLDRLQIPWCGIVGDHDVHEKSFSNFQRFISNDLYSRFQIGPYRFLRMNAFAIPKPDSFALGSEQLAWLEEELIECKKAGDRAVLLLHCYPSDLKQGGEELARLLRQHPVLLVDMGHTHYNELSNDGSTLYSATRSTGQIEEGPVGYSVTTLDGDSVSWHFVELGAADLVSITTPPDERLVTTHDPISASYDLQVHAKIWTAHPLQKVVARVAERAIELTYAGGQVWKGSIPAGTLQDGVHELEVVATSAQAGEISSKNRIRVGALPKRDFAEVDQENAIGEWKERGLLGTQLGPNKNGKKW